MKLTSEESVNNIHNTVIKDIKEKMREKKITQSALAESVGISQQALSKILKKKTTLSLKRLFELYAAIGCTLSIALTSEEVQS